ncbi:MAG: mitochondrial fission ELM1 family protein [Myxococcales bacterium]|nr:mitochondrial fission ELM1 family protein [Myxococcales bacterium]
MSVFIGGRTKSYRIEPEEFKKWLSALKSSADKTGYELLVTTSRRTDAQLSAMTKESFAGHPSCKLLIVANESNVEDAAFGMLALSQVAVVTEDSISMISDAVRAKKQVFVMRIGNGKLSKKHQRFQNTLLENDLIEVANASNFERKLELINGIPRESVVDQEAARIREALRKIL